MSEQHIIQLRVSDMTCGHCEKRVSDLLSAQPGVISAQVDRTKSSAKVVHDGNVEGTVLALLVSESGYPAEAS